MYWEHVWQESFARFLATQPEGTGHHTHHALYAPYTILIMHCTHTPLTIHHTRHTHHAPYSPYNILTTHHTPRMVPPVKRSGRIQRCLHPAPIRCHDAHHSLRVEPAVPCLPSAAQVGILSK
jgi:hypothetical protein